MTTPITRELQAAPELVRRAAAVEDAVHSSEMEGLPVPAAARFDLEAYAAGRLTGEQLEQRMLERIGRV